jgi:hypothetical protein
VWVERRRGVIAAGAVLEDGLGRVMAGKHAKLRYQAAKNNQGGQRQHRKPLAGSGLQ